MLAFHHYWLYGITAAAICANIMREVAKSVHPNHLLSKEINYFPFPKNNTGDEDIVDGYFDCIQALLFVQFDLDFAAHEARYGLEPTINLAEECFDRKTGKINLKGDCRTDFKKGDNNDGVFIIDAITKKYCFMNIYEQEIDEEGCSIYDLPTRTPVSASEYVNVYYATEIDRLSQHEKEGRYRNDEAKINECLAENKEKVEFVKEYFSKFEVLSLEEVMKMFPKSYK